MKDDSFSTLRYILTGITTQRVLSHIIYQSITHLLYYPQEVFVLAKQKTTTVIACLLCAKHYFRYFTFITLNKLSFHILCFFHTGTSLTSQFVHPMNGYCTYTEGILCMLATMAVTGN